MTPISPQASYFDILGVPVDVEDETLTRRFRELSRQYHPDRFGSADIDTQSAAQDSTALINDAYRTLRDPFQRAEYLLRRERGTSLDDLKTDARPPQELFAQVLELQENLMEFQEARMDDDATAMENLRPVLEGARTEFQAAYDTMSSELKSLFTAYEQGDRDTSMNGMAAILGKRGYLRRVLENLQKNLSS